MKLQCYPVLWCLLMVIFLSPTRFEARSNANIAMAKSVETEGVKKIEKLIFHQSTPSVYATALSTNASILEGSIPSDVGSGEMARKSFYEENSYNLSFGSRLNSEKILEKNAQLAYEASSATKKSFLQGLYYGFALMVLLINLVCCFIFDEKLFLFYAITLLGIITVFFYNDGIHNLFGLPAPTNPFLIQSLLLWFAMGSSALFASNYLNMQEFFPKLKLVAFPIIIIGGLLAIMALIFKDIVTAYAANFVSISILVCYFVASVFLFSRKNYAKFYAIAAFLPLLFAVDFFILGNLGINFLSTEAIHVKTAGLIEMLILTYAILYRMRAIKEEHQMRQTEMRIFLKRQETMNRQSAMKLMEDVYLENLIMHYDLDGLEIKLLQYISEGKENDKIARKLKTTVADIEELTKELYLKLEIGEQIQEDYRLLDSQPDYLYN